MPKIVKRFLFLGYYFLFLSNANFQWWINLIEQQSGDGLQLKVQDSHLGCKTANKCVDGL